jgi:hypothetical protein
MTVTALTVARSPVHRSWPGLEHRCLHGRVFRSAADVQRAWFDAIALVETPYFFFVDDDDELPAGYPAVLEQCVAAGRAIAFTDEQVHDQRRHRQAYSQERHLADPTLVHHLVLCDTEVARAALVDVPRGDFWPEMLLYWRMAELGGAAHVPEVGYLWHRRPTGLHSQWFTVRGMHNSRSWCQRSMMKKGQP